MLQSMGLQRVGHNLVTEQQWDQGSWLMERHVSPKLYHHNGASDIV